MYYSTAIIIIILLYIGYFRMYYSTAIIIILLYIGYFRMYYSTANYYYTFIYRLLQNVL